MATPFEPFELDLGDDGSILVDLSDSEAAERSNLGCRVVITAENRFGAMNRLSERLAARNLPRLDWFRRNLSFPVEVESEYCYQLDGLCHTEVGKRLSEMAEPIPDDSCAERLIDSICSLIDGGN